MFGIFKEKISNLIKEKFEKIFLQYKESHLIKNSEWGAVAYLTQSKYGRNGTEVTLSNTGKNYYTAGSQNATALTNVNQSTTGNATGVFDMNGGAWEYVAGYLNTSSSLSNGSSYASSTGTSNEYATVYSSDTADARKDATITGWFSDFSDFVSSDYPFFKRGGRYGNSSLAGVFASGSSVGVGGGGSVGTVISFRVVLAGS